MQFIVIAYDGVDSKTAERRLAARDAHLKSAKEMFEKLTMKYQLDRDYIPTY